MDLGIDLYIEQLDTKNKDIISALKLAYMGHSKQKRKSGEPYINHCIEVYLILKSWGVLDAPLLIAALLHDSVEDTNLRLSEIEKIYGEEVAFLVEGVTKDNDSDLKTLKKLVNGSYVNPKVAVLKIADRLHNLRTLQFMSDIKRHKKAEESLGFYAQLAESLGMWVVKNEFEDLAFKYLDFEKFAQIKTAVDRDVRASEDFILKFQKTIKKSLKGESVLDVCAKKASCYHIYEKGKLYSIQGLSEHSNYRTINDVVSFRVIANSIEDCYKILYRLHKFFGNKVDYERLDEFIGSNKRENGYGGIQTTINTEYGSVEICVVTEDMEDFNNWGFISLLRRDGDISEYKLKLIFTPDTELVFLPIKAAVLDFAYYVNKELGDNAVSSVVNGKEKSLKYKLRNGDTVRIKTGDRSFSVDKNLAGKFLPKTNKFLNKKIYEGEKLSYISQGENLLEQHLSERGILDLEDLDRNLQEIVYTLGCESIDEIYYRISTGYLDVSKLDNLLNFYGITKSNLGWTSIKLKGKDRPGILNYITGVLKEYDGNILKINYMRGERNFSLKIVTEGINSKDEPKIRKALEEKKYFTEVNLV